MSLAGIVGAELGGAKKTSQGNSWDKETRLPGVQSEGRGLLVLLVLWGRVGGGLVLQQRAHINHNTEQSSTCAGGSSPVAGICVSVAAWLRPHCLLLLLLSPPLKKRSGLFTS